MYGIRASMSGRDAHARALKRLAPRYGWSSEELVGIQAQVEVRPELIKRYWRNLAAACELGFVQSEENGFIDLRTWCAQTGRCDPTLHEIAK